MAKGTRGVDPEPHGVPAAGHNRNGYGAGGPRRDTAQRVKEGVGVNVVLIGPPGSGKGTQAARLSKRYDVPTIAFGEVFSEHKERGTDLGRTAAAHMDSGDLVPDEVVISMARQRLSQS